VANPVTCRKHNELCMEPAKGLTALGALGKSEKDMNSQEREEGMCKEGNERVLALPFPLSAPLTCWTKKKFLHHLRFSLALSFLENFGTKRVFN